MKQVQTRIQEGKKYRQSKREAMGETAYKAEEARKRRERRARAKAPTPAVSPQEESKKHTEEMNSSAELRELKKVMNDLNKFLNKTSKIDIPTVRVMLKDKIIPAVVKVEDFKNCDALLEAVFIAKTKIANHNNHKINRKTIVEQFKNIRNLYKHMYGKDTDCTDFDFLKNTTKVIKFINEYPVWKTDSSRNKRM